MLKVTVSLQQHENIYTVFVLYAHVARRNNKGTRAVWQPSDIKELQETMQETK
jgi:hypothetical protein